MRTLIAMIVIANSFVLCNSQELLARGGAGHSRDSLSQVQENLRNNRAVIIDVREPVECRAGHLAKVIMLPLSKLQQTNGQIDETIARQMPKDRAVYIHCGAGGVRALVAGRLLARHGYDVRPLIAGYDDLVTAGFQAQVPGNVP